MTGGGSPVNRAHNRRQMAADEDRFTARRCRRTPAEDHSLDCATTVLAHLPLTALWR
jgi:hypothetical protein